MNTKSVIEALNEMKNVLMERGWNKGAIQAFDGSVCLVGARNLVVGIDNYHPLNKYSSDKVSEAIESVLPESYQKNVCNAGKTKIWMFNDDCQSVNEVLDVLDNAIIAEKERNND